MATIDPIRLLQPNPAQTVGAGNPSQGLEDLIDQGLTSFPDELQAAKDQQQSTDPGLDLANQSQGDLPPDLQNLPVPAQSIPAQTANIADSVDVAQLAQAVPTLPQVEIAQELILDAGALVDPEIIATVASDEDALEAAKLEALNLDNPNALLTQNPVVVAPVQVDPVAIATQAVATPSDSNAEVISVATSASSTVNTQIVGQPAIQGEALVSNQPNTTQEAMLVGNSQVEVANQPITDTQQTQALLDRAAAQQAVNETTSTKTGVDIAQMQAVSDAEPLVLSAEEAKAVAAAALLKEAQAKPNADTAPLMQAMQTAALASDAKEAVNSAPVNAAISASVEELANPLQAQAPANSASVAINPSALRVAADALPNQNTTKSTAVSTASPLSQSETQVTESVLAPSEDAEVVIQGIRADNAKANDANSAQPSMAQELMAKEVALKADNQDNLNTSSSTVAEPTGDPTNRTITSVFNQELRLSQAPFPLRMEPQQASFVSGPLHVEVMRVLREGGGRVIMELTPPDQGTIQLDLRLDGNGKAYLVVEGASDSTKARLEQGGSQLKEQLAQMGLSLSLDMRDRSDQSDRLPFALNPNFGFGNSVNGAGAEAIGAEIAAAGRLGLTPDGRISIYA